MGKEAKIGLSIIGILVIIFAVVLGQRMLGSKDESPIVKKSKKASSAKAKQGTNLSKSKKQSRFSRSKFNANRRKLPPTSTVSGASSGASSASDKSDDVWRDYHQNKLVPPSSLMPRQTGSITFPAQSSSDSTYTSGGSNSYSRDHSSSSVGVAPTPGSNAGGFGTPTQSTYRSGANTYNTQGGYGSDRSYSSDRTSNSYQNQDSRYASNSYNTSNNRTSRDGYQRASLGPKTGGARTPDGNASSYSSGRSASSNYSSDRSSDRNGTRYHSASYDSTSYKNLDSTDYGSSSYRSPSYDSSSSYGSSRSAGSNYDGGSQSDGTYIVKPHQNYWEISKDVYGTGAYFKALAEANHDSIPDENRLKVNDRIKTPDLAELEQTYPDLCPAPKRRDTMRKRAKLASSNPPYGGSSSGRQYIVQSGDTLYDIARYELGDAARWTEIYEINRQVLGDSFDYLTTGLKLTMPSKDKKSSLLGTSDDSSSNYGKNRSQYQSDEKDTPRTASRLRPGTSYTRPQPTSSYQRSNYGRSSNNNGSSYGNSQKYQYQPPQTTYPRN